MQLKILGTLALSCLVLAVGAAWRVQAQDVKTAYPSMAPLDLGIPIRNNAAQESITRDAEVMVLGRHGYETAANGKNGFVCMVQRSWAAGIEDPDFWNPKLRSPICFNAPAARSFLPLLIKKTELILAGRSKDQSMLIGMLLNRCADYCD